MKNKYKYRTVDSSRVGAWQLWLVGGPRVPDGQTPGAGMSQDFTLLRLAGPAHNLIWGEQLAT